MPGANSYILCQGLNMYQFSVLNFNLFFDSGLLYTVNVDILAPVLFSALSPSLSASEFKTRRVPMFPKYLLNTQVCWTNLRRGVTDF